MRKYSENVRFGSLRRLTYMRTKILVLSLCVVVCCGGSPSMAVGSSVPNLSLGPTSAAKKSVVIEASLTIDVRSLPLLMRAASDQVKEMGGYVASELNSDSEHGSMRLRVPSEQLPALLNWMDSQGEVSARRTKATDVSKQVFDHRLALESLNKTLTRMQQLLERPDLDIDSVLKIESEMNRLRTEIEKIQGELRFVKDRVAQATLDINVRSTAKTSSEKFYPGVRVSHMRLLDPKSRSASRLGLGISARVPHQDRLTYSLDVFEAVDGEKKSFVATMGGDVYSRLLGDGKRQFFNPYIGGRIGYGRLEGSNFVLTGEAGLEILNSKYAKLEVNTQLTSFIGKGGPDLAMISGAEFSLAF